MAKQKKKRWSDYLWIVSATYFTLGFFNIVFAWLGVICFLIPLLIAVIGSSKAYCNNYCGRGQLFLQIGNSLVAQKSGTTLALVKMVSKRILAILFVLLCSNDYLDHTRSNGDRIIARNHSPVVDL